MPQIMLCVEESDQPPLPVDRSILIGRHSESTLRLRDPLVSRRQAEVFLRDGAAYLRQLGAANPVRVNGVAVSDEQLLRPGDVIAIARFRIRVESMADEASNQPPSAPPAAADKAQSDNEEPNPDPAADAA
ncbi:MAG: FHA domain-containing protein, partial [Planctomycetota bacterium]